MNDQKKSPLWVPYFKPLTTEHGSGWLCFEIGYYGPHDSKIVLNQKVDVINLPQMCGLRMDHTTDEIRIYPQKGPQVLRWRDAEYSEADLVLGDEPLVVEVR